MEVKFSRNVSKANDSRCVWFSYSCCIFFSSEQRLCVCMCVRECALIFMNIHATMEKSVLLTKSYKAYLSKSHTRTMPSVLICSESDTSDSAEGLFRRWLGTERPTAVVAPELKFLKHPQCQHRAHSTSLWRQVGDDKMLKIAVLLT